MSETALAAAMARAGINTAQPRLRMLGFDVLRKYHGNIERALPTFEKYASMDPELVREALRFYLENFNPTTEGEGRVDSDALGAGARPRDGAGHEPLGHEPLGTLVGNARPVREPSALDRAAAASVFRRISVLDTFKIGGLAIGDWSVVAAKNEGAHMAFHARVLLLAHQEAARVTANIESWMTFRDVLTEKQIQSVIQRASEDENAA